MSKKNLLEESVVRNWMKLSKLDRHSDDFLKENFEKVEESEDLEENEDSLEEEQVAEGEESLDEDNFDKTGPGPERQGTKKNKHDGEKGKAQNQGKEPKDTPDGKLEIPGTGYAGDHKLKSKSPEKGSTDGGTQLQGKGNVTEGQQMDEMDDVEDDDMEGGDELAGPVDDLPPPGPEPEAAPGAGGVDVEGLVRAIVDAISAQTGVDISVDGEGGGMEGPEMGMEPDVDDAVEEPPMGGPEMGPPGGEEEEPDEEYMQEVVSEISKRVAARLLQRESRKPRAKRLPRRRK